MIRRTISVVLAVLIGACSLGSLAQCPNCLSSHLMEGQIVSKSSPFTPSCHDTLTVKSECLSCHEACSHSQDEASDSCVSSSSQERLLVEAPRFDLGTKCLVHFDFSAFVSALNFPVFIQSVNPFLTHARSSPYVSVCVLLRSIRLLC